jgi:hypothetical protein
LQPRLGSSAIVGIDSCGVFNLDKRASFLQFSADMKTTTLTLKHSMHRVPCRLALLIPLALACFAFLPGAQAICNEGCDSSLFNAFLGDNALSSNIIGSGNTAIGWRSLFSNTDASFNTGVGGGALVLNTTGGSNTAVGAAALLLNIAGSNNTAVGTDALAHNTADSNTAMGAFALFNNLGGVENVAVGWNALAANVGGGFSVAVGYGALIAATDVQNNTGVGDFALATLTTGTGNTAIGSLAGDGYTGSESSNVSIGAFEVGVAGESNTIRIADNLPTGAGLSQCFIGGILSHVVPMASGNPIVTIDPVTQQLGMTTDFAAKIAEQQKKIEEQQASISQLKSEMQTMVAQLKEQAAQIQKVSAQLELSKPTTQTVSNNH